jgi:hypothetical protein
MSGPSPDASGMPPAAVARDAINEAWVAVFPDEDSRPARHIVEHDLPQPLRMHCECIAVLSDERLVGE